MKKEKQSVQHSFEDEVFFSLRRQRNQWAVVAMGSIIVAFVSLLTLVVILPLNETKPYVVLVNKSTGESEKLADVIAMDLAEQDAIQQSQIVSYIASRETYDPIDNPTRIPKVMELSRDQAAESLRKEWSSASPNFPPTLYKDERIFVQIKSVTFDPKNKNVAQVRIAKRNERSGVERLYLVTLTFQFKPQTSAQLQEIWKNPLGFSVTTYRLDAEIL
jgi:type IV secretion system protein VirB8